MKAEDILKRIKSLADPEARAGMARFGINTEKAWGMLFVNLRAAKFEKELPRNAAHQVPLRREAKAYARGLYIWQTSVKLHTQQIKKKE